MTTVANMYMHEIKYREASKEGYGKPETRHVQDCCTVIGICTYNVYTFMLETIAFTHVQNNFECI